MKVLFLDVDGVLNDHRKWPNTFAPILIENAEHLNFILEAVPELQIVLSSAWRYRFNTDPVVEALLCCFGINAVGRIHGRTEMDPVDKLRPYDEAEWWAEMGLRWRAEQIRAYLEAHPITHYAVLDDLPLQVEHLYQTQSEVGLTRAIAEQVVAHFAKATEGVTP